jgi:FAD-dependent pyridine nucleotide-disulfide oxidoreductase
LKKKQENFFGGSAIGKKDADKKIDILATAITAGFTASDLAMLELSYMPKYNTATDIINVIGSKGENNNEFKKNTFNNNK